MIKILPVVLISIISFLHADSWAYRAPMPTARNMVAGASVNGKIYVFGGYNGSTVLNLVEEYDPATDTWTTKSPMPTPRYGCRAAAVDGKIYVIGGNIQNLNEEYDPNTDTWVTKSPMPTARTGAAVVAAENGKIYVFGGGNYLAVNECYDPATDSWETKAPMPQGRISPAAGAPGNGKIYVTGGFYAIEMANNWEYDIINDSWTVKTPMLSERRDHQITTLNGKLYATGGINKYGPISDLNHEYDPGTDSWASKTPMLTPTWGFAIAASGNGKFYAIGGGSVQGILNTNQEYTPDVGVSESKMDGFPSTDIIRVSPNPFTDQTMIRFNIPTTNSLVSLYLYDVTGRLQDVIYKNNNKIQPSFLYKPSKNIPSGVYYLVLETEDAGYTKRLVIMR